MSIVRNIFWDSETSRLHPFWRAQLFLFDRPAAAPFSSREGLRLLLVLFFLEVVVRPLLGVGARWLTFSGRLWWPLVQVGVLTVLALWLVSRFAGVPLSQLGLYPWSRWSKTEKFYFLQTIPLSIVIFSVARSAGLQALWARPNLLEIGIFIFIPQVVWGIYQEILYRGVLQTELVRRWGALPGIVVSNLIFTFGPLHAYHFQEAQGNPSHLWIFAAIFAIGLLFAILYHRSGNLWIVGIMHGLGDWFISGLEQVIQMSG